VQWRAAIAACCGGRELYALSFFDEGQVFIDIETLLKEPK